MISKNKIRFYDITSSISALNSFTVPEKYSFIREDSQEFSFEELLEKFHPKKNNIIHIN